MASVSFLQFCFEGEASDMKFKEITEMTLLTVQLIVEFSKQLPGFSTLQQEDKISLLKVYRRANLVWGKLIFVFFSYGLWETAGFTKPKQCRRNLLS